MDYVHYENNLLKLSAKDYCKMNTVSYMNRSTGRRIIFYVFFVAYLIHFSCTQKPRIGNDADQVVIFPTPPEAPKIQYLTSISKSTDITGEPSKFMSYILGKQEEKPIIKPYGIAVHNGKIYICDTMLGGLEIIDMQKNTFEYFKPSGLGQLKKPINCAVDQQGFVYVADSERGQIVIFNSDGQYHKSIGDASEMKPTDVSVTQDRIWVCDIQNRRILSFDKNTYEVVDTFPQPSSSDSGNVYSPTNIYVTENELYVSDFGDFKIKIYAKDGTPLRSIGSFGRSFGQFVRPKGIAVDRQKNLYVVDAGFENVQIFNNQGQLLMFFGGSYKKPGDMWLPAKVAIDYNNVKYFEKYVYKDFALKYLILVTNQYGPDKINIYGFIEKVE